MRHRSALRGGSFEPDRAQEVLDGFVALARARVRGQRDTTTVANQVQFCAQTATGTAERPLDPLFAPATARLARMLVASTTHVDLSIKPFSARLARKRS